MIQLKNNWKISAGWKSFLLPGFIAFALIITFSFTVSAQQEVVFKISAIKPVLYPNRETLDWGVNNYFKVQGLKGTKIDSASLYRGKVVIRDSSLTVVPMEGNPIVLKLFTRQKDKSYKCIYRKQFRLKSEVQSLM